MPFSSDSFGVGRFAVINPGNRSSFYNLDYRRLTEKFFNEGRSVRASGQPRLALSQPALCYHVDFPKDTENPGKILVPFRIEDDGRLDGFLGWFEALLCEGVTLSNSPDLPINHWRQLYLPAIEPPRFRKGQTILLYLDPNMVAGKADWRYAVMLKP